MSGVWPRIRPGHVAIGVLLALASVALAQGPEPAAGGKAPRLVMALYRYDFQGDRRQRDPGRAVWKPDGASALAIHPWESPGPWFSADRVQYHRNQLQLMATAGIDVALVIYRGDREARIGYALANLTALADALEQLRAEGQAPFSQPRAYPQIGLALDLGSLARIYGGPVDLKDRDVQETFYGLIRDFFLHLPTPFRATLLREGQPVCLVRLLDDSGVRDADDQVFARCSERFAREFGLGIAWIGTPGLAQRVRSLDAVAGDAFDSRDHPRGRWATATTIAPGLETLLTEPNGRLHSRENGAAYQAAWRRIHAAPPDWVIVDSWNDFVRGTAIAPSLEYGLQCADLTRAGSLAFRATEVFAARIVRATVPRIVQPKTLYPVEVVVQNSGSVDWDSAAGVFLSYRWLKEGEPVVDPEAMRGVTPAIPATLAQGETRVFTLGVVGPLRAGQPLPAGEYTLEIGMLRRTGLNNARETWFAPSPGGWYTVSVRVGEAPPLQPTWLQSTLPTRVATGLAYRATLRLRNDGSRTWSREQFALGARWRRVASSIRGIAVARDDIAGEIPRLPLPENVPPGREISVAVTVPIAAGEGQPLPLSPADATWYYVLEWDLWDGTAWASQAGGATLRTAMRVVERDPAPRFLGASLPTELAAGRTVTATIGFRNEGPAIYRAGRDRIAVHWYYFDGTEASFKDQVVPLPQDVPPYSRAEVTHGASEPPRRSRRRRDRRPPPTRETVVRDVILRDVPIPVPEYFGPMYCVFDLEHEGELASHSPASRTEDLLVIPVNLFSPSLTPLPLGGHLNLDGLSFDSERTDGDVDGRGNSIPAEPLPPYVQRPTIGPGRAPTPLYPCGIWSRPVGQRDDRVCFMFPSKSDRQPNMIACDGQRLEFAAAPRIAVHVMGFATGEDAWGDFRLVYEDASVDVRRVTMTHFLDPPKHGEHVAFRTSHAHTRSGDDPTSRCHFFHYELVATRTKPLVAIELPRNPAMKVVAVTLENVVPSRAP